MPFEHDRRQLGFHHRRAHWYTLVAQSFADTHRVNADTSGRIAGGASSTVTVLAGGILSGLGAITLANGTATLTVSTTTAGNYPIFLSDTASTGLDVTSWCWTNFTAGARAAFVAILGDDRSRLQALLSSSCSSNLRLASNHRAV